MKAKSSLCEWYHTQYYVCFLKWHIICAILILSLCHVKSKILGICREFQLLSNKKQFLTSFLLACYTTNCMKHVIILRWHCIYTKKDLLKCPAGRKKNRQIQKICPGKTVIVHVNQHYYSMLHWQSFCWVLFCIWLSKHHKDGLSHKALSSVKSGERKMVSATCTGKRVFPTVVTTLPGNFDG